MGVPSFVQKMIADCFEKPAQDDFKTGLDNIEKMAQQTQNQAFSALTTLQKLDILRGVSISEVAKQKEFFTLLKNLTVQGYTSSEYVLVNYYKYDMAPGHFYGCVPV